MPQNIDYHAIAPELIVTGTILILVGLEPFVRPERKWLAMPIALAGVQGAPVPVAAFLSVASKAAGFAGLLQLMFVAFLPRSDFWAPIFAALSIATMTIGNLVALQQRQIVRLLAYSSIAQAGYMLLPFALVSADRTVNHDAFAAAVTY